MDEGFCVLCVDLGQVRKILTWLNGLFIITLKLCVIFILNHIYICKKRTNHGLLWWTLYALSRKKRFIRWHLSLHPDPHFLSVLHTHCMRVNINFVTSYMLDYVTKHEYISINSNLQHCVGAVIWNPFPGKQEIRASIVVTTMADHQFVMQGIMLLLATILFWFKNQKATQKYAPSYFAVAWYRGPLLLTWFNFNLSMDK